MMSRPRLALSVRTLGTSNGHGIGYPTDCAIERHFFRKSGDAGTKRKLGVRVCWFGGGCDAERDSEQPPTIRAATSRAEIEGIRSTLNPLRVRSFMKSLLSMLRAVLHQPMTLIERAPERLQSVHWEAVKWLRSWAARSRRDEPGSTATGG